MTIPEYLAAQSDARAASASPTAADYAAADAAMLQEYERIGRLASRGGELAQQSIDAADPSQDRRERIARHAAFERCLRERGIVPPVQCLDRIGKAPVSETVIEGTPDADTVLVFPRRQYDPVILVTVGGLVYADYAETVRARLSAAGWLTTYWWGDRSRSHLVRNHYLTGKELKARHRVAPVGLWAGEFEGRRTASFAEAATA